MIPHAPKFKRESSRTELDVTIILFDVGKSGDRALGKYSRRPLRKFVRLKDKKKKGAYVESIANRCLYTHTHPRMRRAQELHDVQVEIKYPEPGAVGR